MPWRPQFAATLSLSLSLVVASAFGLAQGAASPSADDLRNRLADRGCGEIIGWIPA